MLPNWVEKQHKDILNKEIKKQIFLHSPTFLAMLIGPTALNENAVDDSRRAAAFPLHHSRAHISTLLFVSLVGLNVVIFCRIQNPRPVDGGQIAELIILLDPHCTAGDVHQAVEANILHVKHLKDDQGVVEEKVSPSDHSQVGEQLL